MNSTSQKKILSGNEAIARGAIESYVGFCTSYPGTPSTEIASTLMKEAEKYNIYTEWSTNEKVALEASAGASWAGIPALCSMKSLGLNVAADSLMSSAYTGVVGGMVVISCDDPGPHSSQTEQDSRFFGMYAKVPVYDPSSPQEAKEMVKDAFELSEAYQIPVLLRPTIRISHGKQSVKLLPPQVIERPANFEKDPERWAATPRFRYIQITQNVAPVDLTSDPRTVWPSFGSLRGTLGIGAPTR